MRLTPSLIIGMRRVTLAFMCLVSALLHSPKTARAQANFFGWHTDLNTAAKVSTKTGKPIFLVFRCVR